MAKPPVVLHRSRKQFAESEKYLIYLACIATEPRYLGFTAGLRPRESGNISTLITNQWRYRKSQKTTTKPDIGDRTLVNTGLRSAMAKKGKHRGPHM